MTKITAKSTNYFNYLPTTNYNGVEVCNLMTRYDIVDEVMKYEDNYYIYRKNTPNERFDVIAHRYYGDSNLAWLVMLSSNIYHWRYDNSLDYTTFEKYIKDKYNLTIKQAQKTPFYHIDVIDKDIIDINQYELTDLSDEKLDVLFNEITVYDHENALNENSMLVKLISKDMVNVILNTMKDLKQIDLVE